MEAFGLLLVHLVAVLLSAVDTVSSSADAVTCDFEEGLCGWRTVHPTGYTFRLQQGPSPDHTSGPDTDHTLQARQGHYIYTSGWDAMGSDDTASIFSRNLSLSAPANLTFWYHMNGNGVGSLALYVHPTAGGGTGAPRWRAQHRQGMQWKEQTVLLESGSWQLEFRTDARHSYGSDIALDDIRLAEPEPTTSTTSTLTSTLVSTAEGAVTASAGSTEETLTPTAGSVSGEATRPSSGVAVTSAPASGGTHTSAAGWSATASPVTSSSSPSSPSGSAIVPSAETNTTRVTATHLPVNQTTQRPASQSPTKKPMEDLSTGETTTSATTTGKKTTTTKGDDDVDGKGTTMKKEDGHKDSTPADGLNATNRGIVIAVSLAVVVVTLLLVCWFCYRQYVARSKRVNDSVAGVGSDGGRGGQGTMAMETFNVHKQEGLQV